MGHVSFSKLAINGDGHCIQLPINDPLTDVSSPRQNSPLLVFFLHLFRSSPSAVHCVSAPLMLSPTRSPFSPPDQLYSVSLTRVAFPVSPEFSFLLSFCSVFITRRFCHPRSTHLSSVPVASTLGELSPTLCYCCAEGAEFMGSGYRGRFHP